MALSLPVEQIIKELRHDGSEIRWPNEPEPKCRQGFHPQELVYIALQHNYASVPIELFPVLNDWPIDFGDSSDVDRRWHWSRFRHTIATCFGIIEGQSSKLLKHAVAYDRGVIYDPAGVIYDYSKEACEFNDFYTLCAWRLYAI
jgi:hypothetical protein